MDLNEILLLLLLFVIVLLIVMAIVVRARVSQVPRQRSTELDSTSISRQQTDNEDVDEESDSRIKELDEVLDFKNNLTYEQISEPVEEYKAVEEQPVTYSDSLVLDELVPEISIEGQTPEHTKDVDESTFFEEETPVILDSQESLFDEKTAELIPKTTRYVSPSLGDLLFPINEPKPVIKDDTPVEPELPEPTVDEYKEPQPIYDETVEEVETQLPETEPEIVETFETLVIEDEEEIADTVEIGEYETIDIDYPEPTAEPITSEDNYLNIDGSEPESSEGVVVCPHCHEKVPESLYCINCGYSLVTRGRG